MKSCTAFMDDKTRHCEGVCSSDSLFIDPKQFQETKKKKKKKGYEQTFLPMSNKHMKRCLGMICH